MTTQTKKNDTTGPSRRGFMAGLGALVVSVSVPIPAWASSPHSSADELGTLSVFVGIAEDGTVNILSPAQEMGQGTSTALAQCLADELDAAWEQVRVTHGDEKEEYRFSMVPLLFPKMQLTGGSAGLSTWRMPMREAGAKARARLVKAAATRWGVKTKDCTTSLGVVSHPEGHSATYGELALEAAEIRERCRYTLKTPDQFTLMGKPIPREDIRGKVTGTTPYGIDVDLPEMVYAFTRSCPVHLGTLKSVDDSAARAMPGVLDVLALDTFVAVVATSWWIAKEACALLEPVWDDGGNGQVSSAQISEEMRAGLEDEENAQATNKSGKAVDALAEAESVLEAVYEVPYLEHMTMEPMNCTVHLQGDRCDLWVGTQGPTFAKEVAAEVSGLEMDQIHVHNLYLGGAFGRRGNKDWVRHAMKIALFVDRPVKMVWSREETTSNGRFRPAGVARYRAAINGGAVTALHARLCGDNSAKSFMDGWSIKGTGLYWSLVAEGHSGRDFPYVFDSHLVEVVPRVFHVDTGFWRSVGQSYTAFFRESFVDELAEALAKDPLEMRRELLSEKQERLRAVMDRCAEEAGWGQAPKGRFQGLAITDWAGSYSAQIVEISLQGDGFRVEKITAVLDCGLYVNPDQVKAQIMGGALMGLSSAVGERITIEKGAAVETNFNTYPVLRMNQSPPVFDIHLMEGTSDEPGPVGEPGTPPAIAAVCNAIFAATGKRIRTLPIPTKLSEIA